MDTGDFWRFQRADELTEPKGRHSIVTPTTMLT